MRVSITEPKLLSHNSEDIVNYYNSQTNFEEYLDLNQLDSLFKNEKVKASDKNNSKAISVWKSFDLKQNNRLTDKISKKNYYIEWLNFLRYKVRFFFDVQ